MWQILDINKVLVKLKNNYMEKYYLKNKGHNIELLNH